MMHAHRSTRRRFLEVSSLSSMALASAEIMRDRSALGSVPNSHPDTAVILVWLTGGLSHIDTYDMKPNAPAEYRGDFRPIYTNVSGIDICELLPMHAHIADRFSLVHSLTHGFGGHDGAHKRVLTGRVPKTLHAHPVTRSGRC